MSLQHNNAEPDMPSFLRAYNHHYINPGFMDDATYTYFLIEATKKAVKRQSAIFKVERESFYNYNYRIRCDISFDALARTLDGTFNVFNLGSFELYKLNPVIEQIKAVQQQTPLTLYRLNFAVNHALSANMLYSAPLDKDTAEHQCGLLNQKVVLLRYFCKRAGFEKQCVDYEAPAKTNMKLVKRQLINLCRNCFYVYQVELFLFVNHDKSRDLDWIMTTDQIGQFIVQLQSTPLYDLIKDYSWRLDYDQNMGYFYVFDCSFDKQDMPISPEDELIRAWHEFSGEHCLCINNEQFYFSQFLRAFNSFEMLNQHIQEELLTYLLAPIELGKYVHLDCGKYKKATFGGKETVEAKKQRNVAKAGNKSSKKPIAIECQAD